ncbi:MAG: energy transducer TonB [Ignavibacteria bacterium]|nr:energy transducer TonB [Ignavibacteria bacterium]
MIASYRHPHRSGEMRRDAYSGYGLALVVMAVLIAAYSSTLRTYPIVRGISDYVSVAILDARKLKIINDLAGGNTATKAKVVATQKPSGQTYKSVDNVAESEIITLNVDVPTDGDNGGLGNGPIGDPKGTGTIAPTETTSVEDTVDDEFVVVTKEPSYDERALQMAIRYPEVARRNGIEGTVLVKALIGVDGSIVTAIVVESENPILEQAAIDGIRSIQFSPANNNGQNVPCHVFVPVAFRLGH